MKIRRVIHSLLPTLTGLALPLLTLGQTIPSYNAVTNVTDVESLRQKLVPILNAVGGVILAIAVALVFYSAFQYLTAQGSEDKIKSARGTLVFALVGIAIALFAFAIPTIVVNFIGK